MSAEIREKKSFNDMPEAFLVKKRKSEGEDSSDAAHPAKRGAATSIETKAVDRVIETFRRSLFFHGTSTESAENIRRHGMNVAKKMPGSMSLLQANYGLFDPASSHNNYFMTLPEAAEYAKMHRDPEIIRII